MSYEGQSRQLVLTCPSVGNPEKIFIVFGRVEARINIHASALKPAIRAALGDVTNAEISVQIVGVDIKTGCREIMVVSEQLRNNIYNISPEGLPFEFVEYTDVARLGVLFEQGVSAVRSSIEAALTYYEKQEAKKRTSD